MKWLEFWSDLKPQSPIGMRKVKRLYLRLLSYWSVYSTIEMLCKAMKTETNECHALWTYWISTRAKLTERKCTYGTLILKRHTHGRLKSPFHSFFSSYIYKLHDLHLQAENYTEAGFTLKLYADMLSWSRETLTFTPNDTVGQQEWERKENLYKEVCERIMHLILDNYVHTLFSGIDFEEFR